MIRVLEYADNSGWLIECPACGNYHKFSPDRWAFNGDLERPTFSPSMLIKTGPMPGGTQWAGKILVCHSFVRDGRIEFLSDCTHSMAGQTVDLPAQDEVLQRSMNAHG